MGIPVGWNMRRNEAKEKDVLRSDVSGTRSPIRRRARGSRPRNPPLNAFDMDALAGASTPRLAHIEHAARLSHTRTQLPPAPPVPALREGEAEAEAEAEAEGRPLDGPADSERPLATLTPGFAPAARSRRPPYEEAMASLRRRARAEHAAPTPSMQRPSPPSLARERRIALADLADGAPPPLLPYDYVVNGDMPWPMRRRHTRYATAPNDDTPNDDTPNIEPTAVSLPPLRRVGHRRIADGPLPASSLRESSSPVSTLDGLGDRERSNSVSSTSSHLPWTTFLSTVVPDPVAPTAESSFASAAASASFTASSSRASSSNSAASSATHLTVPSRHASPPPNESFMRACESSDEDTASDTEDEAAANVLSRRRIRPSYFADEPPSPERYGRRVMQTSRNASAYVRSFYDARTADEQLDGLVDDSAADSYRLRRRATRTSSLDGPDDARRSSASAEPPMDQELRDARSLLERLARRDDVSDDFWASVGLTRSFADGVERVQDRGRF